MVCDEVANASQIDEIEEVVRSGGVLLCMWKNASARLKGHDKKEEIETRFRLGFSRAKKELAGCGNKRADRGNTVYWDTRVARKLICLPMPTK